jgi:hypothetical protein
MTVLSLAADFCTRDIDKFGQKKNNARFLFLFSSISVKMMVLPLALFFALWMLIDLVSKVASTRLWQFFFHLFISDNSAASSGRSLLYR